MGLRSLVPAGARALLSPTGIAGVAVEGVWVTLHLALYPWGLLEDRLDEASHLGVSHLSPVQRGLIVGDVEAAGTPIILIHGVIDNRSIFTLLRRSLRGRGFGRLYALNYSPFTDDITDVAARLRTLIEEVCEQTGLRARAHHRALDGRAHRALLRAAPRRRRPRAHRRAPSVPRTPGPSPHASSSGRSSGRCARPARS